MSEILRGTISYVNYDKLFVTIDYTSKNKQKSISAQISTDKKENKGHYYRVGDVVDFTLALTPRGDKLNGVIQKFLYNTALEQLLNKAAVENRFSGYLKQVDDKLFVKEWNSYLFFPLQLSPWEMPPAAAAENEAISFKLVNLDKPNKLAAELFSHTYIPEYKTALKFFNEKKPVKATVIKISPHSVYLILFDKINGKLERTSAPELKPGDIVEVLISFLSSQKIALQLS